MYFICSLASAIIYFYFNSEIAYFELFMYKLIPKFPQKITFLFSQKKKYSGKDYRK